jgi:hypothetical protein
VLRVGKSWRWLYVCSKMNGLTFQTDTFIYLSCVNGWKHINIQNICGNEG